MPPMPKSNPARRNKPTTRATLSRIHDVVAPLLPDRQSGWHQLTEDWWAAIWSSPMAPEFDSSDRHGLFVLADLVDSFWIEESPKARAALAAEIRLQRQCFGLTPIDRRRLQWEIERGDDAAEKTQRRRTTKPAGTRADPRSVLGDTG